ncbi:MAG: LysR family transcriptional regulator [Synergistaceae bacterium]|nr:LysR family transcriptional regulator [Synergistaceae bacterium]
MDLKQIEYIIAIDEQQSITRAADKLHVTQSALNQQLLRLEDDLNVKLFERGKRIMIPTYAGKIYLDSARKILEIKRETYKIIQDISSEETGEILIAVTPEQGAMMITDLYKDFHRRWPKVRLEIHEARNKEMEQKLSRGEVDLIHASFIEESRNSEFEYYIVAKEHIVLALPSSHRLAHLAGNQSHKTLPGIDLNLLQDDEFIMPPAKTLMRDIIDKAFLNAGFSPRVLFETDSSQTKFQMAAKQIAPSFFPESYVTSDAPLVYFTFEPDSEWFLSIAYRKGAYLTKPEKSLMQMIKQYYNSKIFRGH